MRLALKLITVFVVAVLLITIALSYLTVGRTYELAEKRQREYAERFIDKLHRELGEQWNSGGVEALESYIQTRNTDPFVESRWVWFDDEDPDDSDPYQPRAGNRVQELESDQLLNIITRRADGNRELNTYCRLDIGNARKGGVEFTSSLAEVDKQATETIFQTILMIGIIALLSIGLVLLASVRIVARPLQILTQKTEQIGDGDFGQPIKVSGNDELNQLAESINEMCVRLAHQQQKISQEMSQRRETESQLRHADRLKTVGRLAAGIAHEIGTPLGVISGRAALIAGGQLGEEKQLESAKTIKSEADRITSTICQLLDFARPSSLCSAEFDLLMLVRETVDLVSTLSSENKIEIVIEENATEVTCQGDRNQIEQVLTNLLVNAIQASSKGSKIHVILDRVFAVHPDRSGPLAKKLLYATIEIADFGPGIEKENLKHIFEPFFTTKDIGQGTGLGLSIAYGIIQEHDGWIEVKSEVGKGSRFFVFIPIESDEHPPQNGDPFDLNSRSEAPNVDEPSIADEAFEVDERSE